MNTPNAPKELPDIQRVLERSHDEVTHVESKPVRERFKAEDFWQVTVHVFRVRNGDTEDTVFALQQPIRGPEEQRLFILPRDGKVDGPEAAVREAISRQVGAHNDR